MLGYLLATGQEGRLWCIPVSRDGFGSNSRPTKRQKEATSSSSSIVDETDMYEVPSEDQESEAQGSSQDVQIKLKQLSVSASSTAQNALLTAVNMEWLLGVVPGASFATFGPEGSILVSTNSGSIYLLRVADGSRSCLRESMNKRPSSAVFLASSETRFLSSSLLAAFQPHHVLLEGELRLIFFRRRVDETSETSGRFPGFAHGKVYATPVDSLGRTMPSPAEILSLDEPVIAILSTQAALNAPASDVLLFIGQRGQVLALSEADGLEEKSPSMFLYAKGVDVRKWTIKSPVTSACILGRHRLCYSAASEVYVAHLFTPAPSVRLRTSLEPCRTPVEDTVLRISGKGPLGAAGRDLVAFTARGRLLLVDTSDHLLQRPRVEDEGVRSSWRPQKTRMEDSIQSLLQSISSTEAASESTTQDKSNVHAAVDEIASALRLAFQITADEQGPDGKRLHCTFDVSRQPSALVPAEKLSFARTKTASFDSTSVPTRLSVTVHNRSGFCVSPYWSAVLEVRTVLGSKPVQQLSSVINRGAGLPVGEQCTIDFEVDISGPAIATVYLCHVNDFHEQLLVQSPDGSPQVPGASGILLGRCRLDVLLQGESQQVRAVDGAGSMPEPVLVRDVPGFPAS